MVDAPYILGINAYDHDTAACLMKAGRVLVAVTKERLSRVKHDVGFYADPVTYCLNAEGITLDDVGLVVRNSFLLPVSELERQLRSRADTPVFPTDEREAAIHHPLFGAEPPRVVDCSHHLAHAHSAFALAPFERCAVMVVDGVGSHRRDVLETVPADSDTGPLARESESYYVFEGGRLETVKKVWLEPRPGLVNDEFHTMAGLGAIYSRVSTYVFGDWNRCGEVMGLAPYGTDALPRLFQIEAGELVFAQWPDAAVHPFAGTGDRAWEKHPHRNHWQDLAFRVQDDIEDALLERARDLHARTGMTNLAIAGGVALNCVANGRIVRETPFEHVYIQPAAGDDGIALGCAAYGHMVIRGEPKCEPLVTAYLGRTYSDAQIRAAAEDPLVRVGATVRRHADPTLPAVDLLARGKVLGWYQGGSEFGPRALGNRSILADPRDPDMAAHVNARVKHRQSFRPFAPAVLAEHAADWFEDVTESPFMLQAFRVRPECRSRIPAVVHVDGTARVQTVTREHNPRFHALLAAFHERTGVPILLNTSMNDRGEPIVETPTDALECLVRTGLDALVIHDFTVEKRAQGRLLSGLVRRLMNARKRARALVDARA